MIKLLHADQLPECDGNGIMEVESLTFIYLGHVYQIGVCEDIEDGWFSRQTPEDFHLRRDNHEAPIGWRPELEVHNQFKFGK
jgi:hypothetical protein